MNRYLVELIGTFFLVLTIGCTVIGGAPGVIPPLAVGAVLMVMVFAGGHISGAHYNPAVSVALWLRGKVPTGDLLPYITAQVGGAVLASFVVLFLKAGAEVPTLTLSPLPALVAEFLFTFALVYVVLNVATVKANSGNSFYGLAIGFTLLVGAFTVGSISGGAFNPAVAVALTTLEISSWSNLWIYFVAQFLGAGVAASVVGIVLPASER